MAASGLRGGKWQRRRRVEGSRVPRPHPKNRKRVRLKTQVHSHYSPRIFFWTQPCWLSLHHPTKYAFVKVTSGTSMLLKPMVRGPVLILLDLKEWLILSPHSLPGHRTLLTFLLPLCSPVSVPFSGCCSSPWHVTVGAVYVSWSPRIHCSDPFSSLPTFIPLVIILNFSLEFLPVLPDV